MPTPPVPDSLLREAVETMASYDNNETHAADALGIPRGTLQGRLKSAARRGIVAVQKVAPAPKPPADLDMTQLRAQLMRGPLTLDDIAGRYSTTVGHAMVAIENLRAEGANVHAYSDKFEIPKSIAPRHDQGHALPTYTSRPDGTYVFGFTSDNHLGSKYARLDVLNWLYDEFAKRGVDRVFNAGNWIDGEARFNKFDLMVHGMDAQCRYLAEHYPSRPGIVTYAVAGDDHEGWYVQREGVNIGRYAERTMQDAGRSDWVDMGYMEAFVSLQHAQSGADCKLHLMHPGGGSSYAISYTVQKIVESYEGGEKPAVLLAGHYHKLGYNLVRNVHAIQTGTTEDQTPFMRKKKLAAHVGGGICTLQQDPQTGAIVSCEVKFLNYFVAGYYNNRWSGSGPVTLAERA